MNNKIYTAGDENGVKIEWTELNSVRDLPKESGAYLWRHKGGTPDTREHFTVGIVNEDFVRDRTAWKPA